MFTMIDEIFYRNYQAAIADFNAGIVSAFASLARAIGDSMAALHRAEFSEPWAAKKKPARRV
jgi:hypothetical protein